MSTQSEFETYFKDSEKLVLKFFSGKVAYDDVEELKQETFLRAFKYFSGFDPSRGSFQTWVVRIASNVLLKFRSRKLYEIESEEISKSPSNYDGPEEEFEKKHETDQLKFAISSLTSEEKLIIKYKHEEGRTLEEIGKELNVSRRTVSRKYLVILNKLKEKIGTQMVSES
ncbi:MAG: sigma-70 family RNA polymerase sigma factor [Leptospiraceae bacterium]|nr:sigma-70 family RNA polymerase sigma factor [Leptospiraceae bacterium]